MTCRDTGASILPCPRVPCPLRMSSVPLRYPYSHVPSPQVVPIPVTMSPVFMACPHPHAPCPSRVSSSPWGVPISMAPFPPGCFLFPFCVPRPVTSACLSPHVVLDSPRCPHSPRVFPGISPDPLGVLVPTSPVSVGRSLIPLECSHLPQGVSILNPTDPNPWDVPVPPGCPLSPLGCPLSPLTVKSGSRRHRWAWSAPGFPTTGTGG